MVHDPARFKNRFAYRFLGVVGGVATVLIMHLPVFAGYVKPQDARPPNSATSTSGGRNGGISQDGLPLTLLAPQDHVGKTLSSHPTFAWYVPVDIPLAGEFQIYELTGSDQFQRVLETPYEFTSTQGLMSFTLPEGVDGLTPNADYVWQVLLRYGPRPSDIVKVRAQIERVDSAHPFSEALATGSLEQSEQLAEAGFWYDAFALVSEAPADEVVAARERLILGLASTEAGAEAGSEAGAEAGVEAGAESTAQADDERSHSQILRQLVDQNRL